MLWCYRFHCTPLTDEQRLSYFDLKGFHHPIHTPSAAAQALFDQGLLLAYDFNHPEALKSFQAGLRHDPGAAMLHWGVTYALRSDGGMQCYPTTMAGVSLRQSCCCHHKQLLLLPLTAQHVCAQPHAHMLCHQGCTFQ